MSAAETLCFVVTGEFITQQARAFWNDEDAPERAMELLEGLHGITEAQCLAILAGTHKLVGDSSTGINLVEDENGQGKTLSQVLKKLKHERDEARDERADLIQMAIGDTVDLASPTGRRRVPTRKTQRGPRGRRSLAQGYEFDDLAKGDAKPVRIWEQRDDLPVDVPARSAREFEDDPPPKKPAMPDGFDHITNNTGWLSPDGVFYPCSYGQHRATAEALFENGQPIAPAGDDAWVRLFVSDKNQWFTGEKALFTEKQKELVRRYCAEKQCDLPYWLEDET